MSISFASATGNLFNRLGKLGALLSNVRSHQNTQKTAMTDTTTGVVAQYAGESDLQALMGSQYISLLNGVTGACQTARTIAQQTVSRMVFRDNPRLAQTLTQLSTLASLQEIIRQMKLATATIQAQTITATGSSFTTGTTTSTTLGAIQTSVRRPSDGLVLENSFAESLLLTCNRDSYTGGATAGNEAFSLTGTGLQSDPFAFDWPLGSNCNTSLSAIDGNTDNGSGNLLTNSGFGTFTVANTPDNFTIVTGSAGTQIFQETSIVFDGSSSALKLTGAAAANTELKQTFNSSTGTLATLDELQCLGCNVWMRRDGTAAAAGVLEIALIDGNNNVTQDAAGNNNSFTVDLTALTTSWVAYGACFRTPYPMPSTYALRLKLTTPLTNGRSVYLDKMALGLATQAYTSGPFVSAFSGDTPFQQSDYATVAVTNSRGSGGTLDTFATLLQRLFYSDIMGNELLFPSAASPSISDGLIA